MRTTINIPDDLLKKAKIKAVQEGITLKQFFVRCLEQEVGQMSIRIENTANPPNEERKPAFRRGLSGESKIQIDPRSSGFETFKGFNKPEL